MATQTLPGATRAGARDVRGIGCAAGVALACGAPALVLLAATPVAQLAGPPSVLVWALSALIGLVMAVVFAELASTFPTLGGGVPVLAAQAFTPRRRTLALLGQWSYWLGWSPAMAISAGLIGEYVHHAVAPNATPWIAWLVAGVLLTLSAVVNAFGIRVCACVQLALVVGVIGAVALLTVLPLVNRVPEPAPLTPFVPPGGWGSWDGVSAIAGAFFLAGWTAYAAEIVLTYGPEHRQGVQTAVRALLVTGVVMVAVCIVVPLALFPALSGEAAAHAESTLAVLQAGAGPLSAALLAAITLTVLILGVNTIAVGDSRVLCQMARNGDAWACLGRLNRRGVPANALAFDVAANAVFLAIAAVITGGSITAIPLTLLIAANVAYLTSMSLALVAAWLARRQRSHPPRFQAPRGFMAAGLAIAAFNLMLIAGAGTAWGWRNVGLGAAMLAVLLAVLCAPVSVRRAPRRSPRPPRSATPHHRR